MAIRLLSSESIDGALTLTGSLTGQGATFAGNVQANGGIKVVGPASHNTIQSANAYVLGLNDQNGTSQWWFNAYTNGNFAIHENNVGDKFTIAAGGNATFAGIITTETGGSVFGGSGGIPIYARSTGTVSYMQFQTSSTGSNGSSDGLTVGVNGSTAYIWNRENTTLHLGTNDTSALALDNSQNATFAGDVVANGTIQTLASNANLTISGDTSGNVYYNNTAGEHRWRANGSSVNSMTLSSSLLTVNENATFTGSLTGQGATFAGNTQINGTLGVSGLLTATSIDTNAYLSNGSAADLHGRYLGQAIYGSGTGSGDNYGTVADVLRYKDIAIWRKNSSTNVWSNPSDGDALVNGNYAHSWGGYNMDSAYSEYVFYFSNTLGYSFISQTIIQHSTNGNSFNLYIERASSTTNPYDTTGWTTMVTQTGIASWPGITCNQTNWEVGGGYPGLMRIRIVPTWNNGNVINIGSFQGYGSYGNFSHAWTTLFDRSVNFQSKIGVGTNPSRALDVTQTALIQGAGNVNAGTLALGPRSSGSGKWSSLTGAHYNQASGSGNGSGSAGIMMIGTYGSNGENDVYIGGGLYEVNAATAIRFYTHTTDTSTAGGSPRMNIIANGNVGIGTTSPSEKLSVASGNISINNSASFMVGGATGDTIIGRLKNTAGVLNLEGDGTRSIRFGSGTNGEVVRIDNSNQRVGIGTTSPDSLLQLESSANPDVELKISNTATVVSGQNFGGSKVRLIADGTNGDGEGALRHALISETDSYDNWQIRTGNELGTLAFDTLGSLRMGISSSGRVTINTTAVADAMCTIAGNSSNYALNLYADVVYAGGYRYQRFRSGSNIAGGIEGSNQTSVAYNTSSDYRMKKNIKPLEDGLDRLCKLKPVKFDWKLNDESTEGFIAHEVQDVFPEAVSGKKDGEDMQGMDYGRITPLLVAAIQELKAEIEILKSK